MKTVIFEHNALRFQLAVVGTVTCLAGTRATPAQALLPLSHGPYAVDTLGTVLESATLDQRLVYRLAQTGHTHLMLYYWGISPFQLVDVDLEAGDAAVVDAAPGRAGPNATLLHSSGKVYIGTYDPGWLLEFDPRTHSVRTVGRLADKGAQFLIEGDDGAIYIGEATKGYVERYDPGTGALQSLGIIDDPGPPYYRYAYTVGADGRYVYVGVGQAPWYLVVYDRSAGVQKVFWRDLRSRTVTVIKGKDGAWYAKRCGSAEDDAACSWFRLEHGEPTPCPPIANGATLPRGNVLEPAQAPSAFGYEIDLSKATPSTATAHRATLRWRRAGEPSWRQTTVVVRTQPRVVKRLYPYSSSQLLALAEYYGPVVAYDPYSRASVILGDPQASLYDALLAGGVWYLAGYPAATLRYDPSRPWTLTASTSNRHDRSVNPYMLAGVQKYDYYLARGADGDIYVGVHHERDSSGGELVWYDTATDVRESVREPFEQFDVAGLAAVQGGAKIVYSSTALAPATDAKLFVFDVATKRIEREIVPLPGTRSLDKIVEVARGVVLGIADTRVYAVRTGTGEILYARELGGEPFRGVSKVDRRLVVGPDGYVWLPIDSVICRIDPANGSVEYVLDGVPARGLLFFRNDLYLYGDTSLRRVRGLFARP
jgi:hypothetical protein